MVRSALERDGVELVEHAADHLGDQVGARQVLGAVLADELAVAQDRDPVGDLVDLVEEVADEQDGDAPVAQVADHGESRSTSSRSRLDVGSSRISTRASRTIARLIATSCWTAIEWLDEQRVGVEPETEVRQVPGRLPVGGLPVDAAAAARLVAEHHVLADRQVRAEVDLLVDRRDAGGLRVGGGAEDALLAGDGDRAVVDGVDAGERLDEGGLPAPFSPMSGVHLAGAEEEVDVVEREDAREADRDAAHLDERWRLGVGMHVRRRPLPRECGSAGARGDALRRTCTQLMVTVRRDQYGRESMTSAACSWVKFWSST